MQKIVTLLTTCTVEMLTRMIRCTVFVLMLIGLPFCVQAADVPASDTDPRPLASELGAPFCDNMVLQRDMPVPIWGWSKPGTQVTVEFASQQKTAIAGIGGRWMV